ncbi:MAG: four helix bundle protein [Candidatus Magasanikbacteria bacterium CG10_big_fil_rev_8_21_14_0_10_36_16]|uniref:Four helix bundle protein n=1 Tax=Candidatus Magasanikbacteria bacterium CG10_big_fil_rev_8_21_14_0_10_36_16 TaxID=1974645 RepID=A0A2H0TYJ1_9BACT|nr:MAG: four helix bundle protein [Candidatus Magasanikbacteria bacterium CG10_big_fil_rev_8_21_14_0_10_36_16]
MEGFKKILKQKMHNFVEKIFLETKNFPKEEIYVTTSQLKRAALSIILNYTEGYARFTEKNQLNFMRTSFGSAKETEYLLYLSKRLNFLPENKYKELNSQLDEINAMLWSEIDSLSNSIDSQKKAPS